MATLNSHFPSGKVEKPQFAIGSPSFSSDNQRWRFPPACVVLSENERRSLSDRDAARVVGLVLL